MNKPVNCGCGGEANVISPFMHTDIYLVECNECGICTSSYNTKAEAIEAWNRAMGATNTNDEDKVERLVNEFEEILAHVRESTVSDCVCGLCEYDGAYIGQSGDWMNECPGFDKDDCFVLKKKYRKEWLDMKR